LLWSLQAARRKPSHSQSEVESEALLVSRG
jgi:hypothetical protein